MAEPELRDPVGAVEAPAARVRPRRSWRWGGPLALVAAAGGFAVWLLGARCGAAADTAEVEALTADAQRFVTLIRSGLPPQWSIERALEHSALRPSATALRELREQRGQARVDLERKLLALWPRLGDPTTAPPDLSGFTRWVGDPAWMSRAEIEALAAALGALDADLAALRARHGLSPASLPLGGEPLAPVPVRIELPPLPPRNDPYQLIAAPLPLAAVIVQRGKPMGCRYRRCLTGQVTWLAWDGQVIGTREVPPAAADARDLRLRIGPDGTVYRVETDARGRARIDAYSPEAVTPVGAGDALAPAVTPYGNRLDGREGSTGGGVPFADRSTLTITRNDGVVLASRFEAGETQPEEVIRLADFSGRDEAFLREIYAAPEGRAVLVFEGEMSRASVLLSSDGGRTWTGAPPANERGRVN